MPVTITPTAAVVPDEIKVGAVNIRRRHQAETAPNGVTYAAGTIFAVVVLSGYRGGVFVSDLPPIAVPDVAAWIADLAAAGDPLTATAAAMFAGADDGIKWIAALRGSQLGLCDRPTA